MDVAWKLLRRSEAEALKHAGAGEEGVVQLHGFGWNAGPVTLLDHSAVREYKVFQCLPPTGHCGQFIRSDFLAD